MRRYDPAKIIAKLDAEREFPVMSSTARRILRVQANPNSEIRDLTEVVEESPSLAAQVVKWANSPYYGFPEHIKTIDDAISKVLGFDLVLNLALGIAIGG